jgi:hypothetical protein
LAKRANTHERSACQADPFQFGLLWTGPAFCDARVDAGQIFNACRTLDLQDFSACRGIRSFATIGRYGDTTCGASFCGAQSIDL